MSRSRLVYTTDDGRVCPVCGRPVDTCTCAKRSAPPHASPVPADGVARVRRETKGRAGKTATTVHGLPSGGLDEIAGKLKRRLGTGGGVKDGVIVIQGDHVQPVLVLLGEMGYRAKRSGG